MNRLALILAALLIGAATPPPAASTGSIRLNDLTDDFERFWERSQSLAQGARVAAFKAEFATLIPGFYDPARLQLDDPGFYDKNVAGVLGGYPRQRDGVREVSRRFAGLLAPAQASFERALGPFAAPQTVYLVHSLGEMDGGTRTLSGKTVLIFGADVIARLHLGHDIQPFFHHELFHIRHADAFRECDPLWCGLWTEGLATYAAATLNPGATDAELLLSEPEPIRAAVAANRKEAVCTILARLDSTDRDAGRALFSYDRLNERLPPRFGYYVGYLAAAEAGKTRSLKQLAQLPRDEVRPLLEASLRALETCPAA